MLPRDLLVCLFLFVSNKGKKAERHTSIAYFFRVYMSGRALLASSLAGLLQSKVFM